MRIFLILFLLFSALPGPLIAKEKTDLRILQYGKEIPVRAGTVRIKKKPFAFKLILRDEPSLKINFSKSDHVYRAAREGIDTPYLFPFWTDRSYAVTFFNRHRHIILSEDANNHWFYDGPREHNFTSVRVKQNRFILLYEIGQYYAEGRFHPLEKLPVKQVYVTAIHFDNRSKIVKRISFKPLADDQVSPWQTFARWALERKYVQEDEITLRYRAEIKRITFIIEFIP